ncbi:inositol monophosphatase family protein [Corynebacterium glucuronolyticum]
MEVQRLADTAEQLIVSQWDDFMDGYGRATARRKRDGSPVTDTDENIESRLHTLLEKETGIAAVGEETIGCVSSRGEEVARLHDAVEGLCYWVVDPIDGTSNYLRGNPSCAILGVLISNERPLIGVTSLPAFETTITSIVGEGITVTVRGERRCFPMRKWGADDGGEELVEALVPDFLADTRRIVSGLIERPQPRLRISGCVGANLGLVAAAGVGTTVSMSPHVWDNGAGVCHLLARGAYVTDLRGNPWSIGSDGVIGGVEETVKQLSASLRRIGR